MKYLMHIWNRGVRNMYFTYEMEHSLTKYYLFIFIGEIAREVCVTVHMEGACELIPTYKTLLAKI